MSPPPPAVIFRIPPPTMSGNEKSSLHEAEHENAMPGHEHLGRAQFMEVMNAEYALALSTGPQLKATSWRSLQLFAIMLVAYMGSMSNGFDGSGMR